MQSNMTSYKLTYFNIRGIGEPIRLLFTYAEVPFEDHEIDCKKWPQLKKDFKWEQLPYLEFDGIVLTQTTAILNFLAKKFDLFPKDPLEQARLDEIMGAMNDLRLCIKPLILVKFGGGNPESAEALKQELISKTIPMYLENVNQILKEIRGSNHHPKSDFVFGGDRPTSVDFYLAYFTESWETFLEEPDILQKYELLQKQQKAVYSLPKIEEWIAKRPKYFI